MKKLLSVLLLCSMMFSFVACGKKTVENVNVNQNQETKAQENTESAKGDLIKYPNRKKIDESQQIKVKDNSVLETSDEYTVYNFSCINSSNNKIKGMIYVPQTSQKEMQTVIISEDYDTNYKFVSDYAQQFAKNGIAAVIFDFYGCASYGISGGDQNSVSALTDLEDLKAVIDMTEKLDITDINKIYLMGEGLGGLVSLMEASENNNNYAGLILMNPSLNLPDLIKKEYASKSEIPSLVYVNGLETGSMYYKDAFDIDVWSYVNQYDKNVLIIHGVNDTVVPISYSQEAKEKFAHADMITIEDTGHGFLSENCFSQVSDKLVEYIKKWQ